MSCLKPFLEWILGRHARDGGLTEIRVLTTDRGTWSTLAGPDDLGALVEALTSGPHPRIGDANVYFGLHPARRPEQHRFGFRRVHRATRDVDVHAYSLFAVDVDPERKPKGRSATDAEKAEARIVADRVRGWLDEQGVDSLLADSGNGWHVLVPLVPAHGDDIAQAARDARALLRWLDSRFSTPTAKVDTSTFNPSRILKLYGSLAMKGASTPETPHRWSSIDLSVIPEDTDLFARIAAETRVVALPKRDSRWDEWRKQAVAAVPLDAVYGEWLTGRVSGEGWLQCRDPFAPSGDEHPSAGVADGTGEAERGAFHSFRSGQTDDVFGFLVRTGRATDFRSACAVVGSLSGVQTPDGRTDRWARLRLAWSSADAERRDELVRASVDEVLAEPRTQQAQALTALREVVGADLREVVRAARDAKKQDHRRDQVERTPRGRVVVDHIVNRDSIEDLFVELIEAVKPFERLFRTERELVFVRRGVGPILVTERNVAGLLSALVEIRLLRDGEDGEELVRFTVLPMDLSRAFVSSPRVHMLLPLLRQYTRSPQFDRSWAFVAEPGYHAPSATFYDGPAVEVRDGVDILRAAVADFHWRDAADQVNFVGALLTALTMPHWGRGHPFLAINGNKPGVGKSTLARVLGVIAEGGEPNSISYTADDAEFEKQLATRIEQGDRVVVVDNAKTSRPIQSPVLERCITDTKLNFRRLGGNSAISRPQNDVLFCLTMNLVQLGPDLRRRALPLNLELDGNVRSTKYAVGDLVGWVTEHRLVILGELAGMVLRWVAAGQPSPDDAAEHSTSQAWAATIDGILRGSGFEGFLSNFEASEHLFDPRYALMAEVVREHHGKGPLTPANWVPLLENVLEERFRDGRGSAKSARAKATVVGGLFTEYLDARFDVDGKAFAVVRDYPEGTGKSPTYAIRPVMP